MRMAGGNRIVAHASGCESRADRAAASVRRGWGGGGGGGGGGIFSFPRLV